MTTSGFDMLRALVTTGSSDMHLKAGSPPGFRIDGHIQEQQQFGTLTPQDTQRLAKELRNEERWKRFEQDLDLDFSVTGPTARASARTRSSSAAPSAS